MHEIAFAGSRCLPTVMMLVGWGVAIWFYLSAGPTFRSRSPASSPALPLPAQQVVLRRALRLPLRAPDASGSAACCGSGGDGWLIDGFGPDGVSARVIDVTRNVVRLQTGYLYHYAFAMLIGVAAFITWFMFASGGH